MRRAAKRDDNEAMVVRALGSAGWTVVRVSDAGAPDLLCARMGELRLLEVKGPKGTLTGAQEVAFERLNKAGVTVLVVRSPRDALEALGAPQSFDGKEMRVARFVAENGAYLCEQCWLPENGLHAKDCPTRLALKRPPKVETAHRAAKKAREVLPKARTPEEEAMKRRHTKGPRRMDPPADHSGVSPDVLMAGAGDEPMQPIPGLPMAPDWMAEAVREHHEELRKASSNAEAMAASSRASDDQRRAWAKGVVERQAPTCTMGPCQRERVANERFCDLHVGGIILVDIEEDEPRKPLTLAGLQAAVKRIHEPRGVEGELQPIKKPCSRKGCAGHVRRLGGSFCDKH